MTTEMTVPRPNNRTRTSRSLPFALVRRKLFHMLPVYWLMQLSDLGREGIANSGSYEFADHIYRSDPSGRTFLGRWLDGRLLAMPATRAFRERYAKSQEALRRALLAAADDASTVRILAITQSPNISVARPRPSSVGEDS